jgi:hypothetical protein
VVWRCWFCGLRRKTSKRVDSVISVSLAVVYVKMGNRAVCWSAIRACFSRAVSSRRNRAKTVTKAQEKKYQLAYHIIQIVR